MRGSSWPALWFATRLINDLRLKNDGFSVPFLSPIRPVVLLFSLNYNLGATIYFRSLAFFHGRTNARRSSNLSTTEVWGRRFYPVSRSFLSARKPREIYRGSRLDWLTIFRVKSLRVFIAIFSSLVPPISNFDLSRRRIAASSLRQRFGLAFCSSTDSYLSYLCTMPIHRNSSILFVSREYLNIN